MKSLVIPRSAACRKVDLAIVGAKFWNGEKLGDELALLSLPHEEIHALKNLMLPKATLRTVAAPAHMARTRPGGEIENIFKPGGCNFCFAR